MPIGSLLRIKKEESEGCEMFTRKLMIKKGNGEREFLHQIAGERSNDSLVLS